MGFRMNKVAAAVTATLGVAMVGVGSAQADEILFPYIVTSSTVTTLVSTINNAGTFTGNQAPTSLHYRYWYKNGGNAENNAATCDEVDRPLPSSANDIVTIDVGGMIQSDNLGILFEKVSESTLPKGDGNGYGSSTFSLLAGLTQPVRAFLVVDNNDFSTTNDANEAFFRTSESLAGEAIVLEFKNGAAWGYTAYNPSGRYNPARFNFYDFSDYVETAGEVIAGELVNTAQQGGLANGIGALGAVPIALAPRYMSNGTDDVITKLFVTPIAPSRYSAVNDFFDSPVGGWVPPGGGFMTGTAVVSNGVITGYTNVVTTTLPNQLRGDLTTQVRLATVDPNLGSAVIYDRDEGPVSGQVPQTVRCVGAVDVLGKTGGLLSEGARLQVPEGGWSNLVVGYGGTTAGSTNTDEAVVIKLEYNPNQTSSFDTTGIVNNGVWLRKGIKESIPALANGERFKISASGQDRNVTSSVAD